MSDPKRATLITAGAPKSVKNKVNKTVRLTINLDESNESKYPELNYKELVITEERKKRVENGKRETAGLDPFSESNEDVERIARKLEQKYGGKSAYGRKSRSKHDDFADIGAGYDENDSFIDNTDGYDEMIPPECDTLYGGFYINCGSLEFKNVSTNQDAASDGEAGGQRRNKRRISSSSSEEESSDSSSESSQDEKDPKAIANGDIDSHKTEHRKKKIKKVDKQKAKKVRRTDSSAATSGKQTSDDNAHGDGESADSRTSQSDSLTSKPAPSSENAITSDSSRDVETKVDMKLPSSVLEVVEAVEEAVSKYLVEHPNATSKDLVMCSEEYISRLVQVMSGNSTHTRRVATRLSRVLRLPRASLLPMLTAKEQTAATQTFTTIAQSSSTTATSTTAASTTAPSTTTATTTVIVTSNKRKVNDRIEDFELDTLTEAEREAKIVETLKRLQALIEERRPGMISNYNAECERVQEERKKLQIASSDGKQVEKRLPKRRFPWCARSRALVCTLARLAADAEAAAHLLQARALPLFPAGFVRMPTLLRQADLNKEIKATDLKRQRLGSASLPNPPTTQLANPLASLPAMPVSPTPEPIQFPSSLTVTTAVKPSDKPEVPIITEEKPYKSNSILGSIINTFTLNKDLIIEKPDRKDTETKKEDLYIPPNNIGSITITPVPNNPPKPDKKPNNIQVSSEKASGLIRVKSPAALNEMVKKDRQKKPEKPIEKRIQSPLHVDTSYQPNKKDPSPKNKDEIPQKHIETMRVAENNIPRPALVPVHHSPTFAKPDKRPPEIKKKKEVIILSDVDPLSDQQEPLAVDDSSSDVEVVEDTRTETSELKSNKSELKVDKTVSVPSKDRNVDVNRKVSVKCKEKDKREEEVSNDDICNIMRNIREMEVIRSKALEVNSNKRNTNRSKDSKHSQEPAKFNSNSFGGVITNAKHERSSSLSSFPKSSVFGERDKDKLTERTSLNKMDGCNGISD